MYNEKPKVVSSCPPSITAPIFEKTSEKSDVYVEKFSEKIRPTAVDAAFALVFLVLAWCYWDFQWHFSINDYSFKYALFTLLFAGAVLSYNALSGRRPKKESFFWLGITLVLGLATLLPYRASANIMYSHSLIANFHIFALHIVACYWALSASGRLIRNEKTSNWIIFDLINAMLILPFGNFLRLPVVLCRWIKDKAMGLFSKKKKKQSNHRFIALLIGIVLSFLCLAMVLPLLFEADKGFSELFSYKFMNFRLWIADLFQKFDLATFISKGFFIIPTASYLYGLAYGCVHGRRGDVIKAEPIKEGVKNAKVLPRLTVLTVLFSLCGIYLIFIAVQIKYLVYALWSVRPVGFSYAEYARSGFFELCRIAVINLCILLASNILCRREKKESMLLRICNILVALLTLLLLTTAAAKMGLYMLAYGLTVKRVLVSVFLIWIAIVFVCVIIQQFKPLQIVRMAVFTGAVMFTLLCVLPTEMGVEQFNQHMGYDSVEESIYY